MSREVKNMFIKHFQQLNKNDANIAGGKGASLGEMTQAGILIPPGFVVLATGFDQFLKGVVRVIKKADS